MLDALIVEINICEKFVVSIIAPSKPTAAVTFLVNPVSTDLSFKCEVATPAGSEQTYKVRWFIGKGVVKETPMGEGIKAVDLKASSIGGQDFSVIKTVCVLKCSASKTFY